LQARYLQKVQKRKRFRFLCVAVKTDCGLSMMDRPQFFCNAEESFRHVALQKTQEEQE